MVKWYVRHQELIHSSPLHDSIQSLPLLNPYKGTKKRAKISSIRNWIIFLLVPLEATILGMNSRL
jgi:hypothetical protein